MRERQRERERERQRVRERQREREREREREAREGGRETCGHHLQQPSWVAGIGRRAATGQGNVVLEM